MTLTFQPPLYNFLMHFWLKVNDGIFWFRLFNVVIGFAAGLFMFFTVKKLYNIKVAVVTLSILAICYRWIYCIQECSEYALMLVCLFAALYFYVSCNEKFTYGKMTAFILSCVLAIYSQYGAVFVAAPLLCLFYIRIVFQKTEPTKKKVILTLSYLVSLIVFAWPLYHYFLEIQLNHNKISENTLEFSAALLTDLPFMLGRIIGFLFNNNSGNIWPVVLSLAGIVLIALAIDLCLRKHMSWIKRSLCIALLICYGAHYMLVQLHIYAMVHAGQSSGFFSRYSCFYIPLLCIVLPIIFMEARESLFTDKHWKKCLACVLAAGFSMVSFVGVLQNWHKAYDDQFAEIWLENEGWNDVTYLYGVTYGFYYYVEHSDNFDESYLNNVTKEVDDNNLPESFWAWRSNWSGDHWKDTIAKARELEYDVTVYRDSGSAGQLAYCTLRPEK